jgi:phosphonate transport system permease protein
VTDATAIIPTIAQYATAILRRKRLGAFGALAVILAYFAYVFVAFDIPGIIADANADDAATLVSDTFSYKTHVTRDNRTGEIVVAIEGERKGEYPAGIAPDWVILGDTTTVDLTDGNIVTLGPDAVTFDVPGYGIITARPGPDGVNAALPDGPLPGWINASDNRVTVTTDSGRVTITRNRTEVLRYFAGWELFFFTLDSPYQAMGWGQIARRAVSGEAGAIWDDFWHNQMWRHSDVAWAIFETILMAFLGTFGAAMFALPLGFLAARNFTPLGPLRFAMRRVFDFLRGVDGLIWTIILSRAFGPGPMTGALAILVTDTGSFGKIFSEALENVDDRQIEGVTSTGAAPLQRYRFGVIPQVTPVLLSQVLYFLESNTRSATIIGAITGGGIGLLLTQAIITQKDWEEVSYYILLILLMVILMDWFSGWLRRRLIGGA